MESRLGTLTVNFTPETPESELLPTPLSCPYVSLPLPFLLPSQALSRVTSSDGGGGSPGCSFQNARERQNPWLISTGSLCSCYGLIPKGVNDSIHLSG